MVVGPVEVDVVVGPVVFGPVVEVPDVDVVTVVVVSGSGEQSGSDAHTGRNCPLKERSSPGFE